LFKAQTVQDEDDDDFGLADDFAAADEKEDMLQSVVKQKRIDDREFESKTLFTLSAASHVEHTERKHTLA
jgi:hypothetical protein